MQDKYFVTSDIHGAYDQLTAALDEKGFDKENPQHKLVVCGDIFDRFNQANELLTFLKNLGDRFIFVRGNHEILLEKCVHELCNGHSPASYHYSNGTMNTISQLTDTRLQEMSPRNITVLRAIWQKMKPILAWIKEKSVNYYELGDYIFVHGWFPPALLEKKKEWDLEENQFLWEDATWLNGMAEWQRGCNLEGKTIVCGHWHCSWGWSHIKQERKEFPNKGGNPQNPVWKKSFEPFVENGIIALDSCVAYSGFLNCIIIEDDKVIL